MKKLLFSAIALIAFTTTSMASEVTKKEVSNNTNPKQTTKQTVKVATVKVYCGDVYVGTITCDGYTSLQLANAAIAMCS